MGLLSGPAERRKEAGGFKGVTRTQGLGWGSLWGR